MREQGRFGRGMGRMRRGDSAPGGEESPEGGFAGGGQAWMQRPLLRRLLMRKLMQEQRGLGHGRGERHSGQVEAEDNIRRLEQLVDRLDARLEAVLRELKDLRQTFMEAPCLRSSTEAGETDAEGDGTLKSDD